MATKLNKQTDNKTLFAPYSINRTNNLKYFFSIIIKSCARHGFRVFIDEAFKTFWFGSGFAAECGYGICAEWN